MHVPPLLETPRSCVLKFPPQADASVSILI